MIVDASVVFKWFVAEDDSPAAVGLLSQPELVAPDLIFSEVANALWKRRRRGETGDYTVGLAGLPAMFTTVFPCAPLAQPALDLAIALDHPVYDCFYLALAMMLDTQLVTADIRFRRACADTAYARRIMALA